MIIWQGFGLLGLIIPVVFLFYGADFLAPLAIPMPYEFYVSLIASAAIVWLVGIKLNNQPPKERKIPFTQRTVMIKTNHSVFWIPMQWLALLPLAIVLLHISLNYSS